METNIKKHKLDLSDQKTLFMGIQGSGKTQLGKHFTKKFKRPVWYIVNIDDAQKMPTHVVKLLGKKSTQELNDICASILKAPNEKKPDCLVFDDAEFLIPSTREGLQKFPALYDIFINHRHHGLAIFLMTRRPSDLNPLVVESCEHKFIFALETSDNVRRKLGSIHSDLIPLMSQLTRRNHKFIYLRLGEKPIVFNAVSYKDNKPGRKVNEEQDPNGKPKLA